MCDQQFVLRWHYHELTLLRNLPFLLDGDVLTDVTLSVGAQTVRAHRLVLAMCSVYFLQLFQEMGTAQHPVIVLNNVSLDDIKAVLAFMYRGQCIVSKERLPGLLAVAKLLKIQGLCDMKAPPVAKVIDDSPPGPRPEEVFTNNHNHEKPPTLIPAWSKIGGLPTASGLRDSRHSPFSDVDGLEGLPSHPRRPPPLAREPTSAETCKCFLCGKYLSNQYNLRVHMETHEETYHACQSCPHVSRSRDALRKHVSYRHPEEYHTRKRKKPE